nr:SGNH/GDSL hydrolase family protein [Anabaena sphaerica]
MAKEINILKQKLNSDTQIINFDVHSLYQESMQNPSKFGFTNVTNACLYSLNNCDHPDKFLFWDGIHPTTAARSV